MFSFKRWALEAKVSHQFQGKGLQKDFVGFNPKSVSSMGEFCLPNRRYSIQAGFDL